MLKLIGGTLVAGTVVGAGTFVNAQRFSVTRHKKTLPQLQETLKLAQLSDLHFGRFISEDNVAAWVDATLAENPDLILMTGDMIDYATRDTAPLIRQLQRLEAPLGVHAVLGNHDYDLGMAFLNSFKQDLSKANVNVLVNRGSSLRDDFFLAGLDDKWEGQPDVTKALANRPDEQACLLMSHIPDMLPHIPQSVDLTLCGHTHGGQIKLPLIGAVFTASDYGKRFLEGWMTEPVSAYVSRGLGVSGLPFRYLSRAELVVMELIPAT